MIETLAIGDRYSNEEIFKSLGVSNAGGIRVSVKDNVVTRAVIMTSVQDFHGAGENPYHDRLEGATLTFTAAGKQGEQTLSGVNNRLVQQKTLKFPIHGFVLVASRRDTTVGARRWQYLGLLEYLRHYPDTQLDANGKIRTVWLFEFGIHTAQQAVPLSLDRTLSNEMLDVASLAAEIARDDDIIDQDDGRDEHNAERIEQVRSKLLAMEPKSFEFFIKDLCVHCGFHDVCVTRYSSDGGIDVNARTGPRIWAFESTLVQIQAKRWLHSVGRKEVAELRGSLRPFAKGAVLTTGHFSKAAINEASEEGKSPITLVDGFRLSKIVISEGFQLSV